jgi:hypothetical protein
MDPLPGGSPSGAAPLMSSVGGRHEHPRPRRGSRSALGLFFGGTFGLSWLLWGAALLAGGRLDLPLPYVLFVVGAFGPTLVAAALWLAGRRRARGPQPFRGTHRWLPPALVLGAAPALVAALLRACR